MHLDAGVDKEACPLNLAPTASTTAALALGDALAVALLDARGFTRRRLRALASRRQRSAGACCCMCATSCAAATRVPRVGRDATLEADAARDDAARASA